jgi:hypothetical protein
MASDTDIDICSRALILIGEAPISSFGDGNTAALVASNLYRAAVRHLLSSFPWRFAQTATTINAIVTTIESKYSAAFQLPGQLLRVMALRDGTNVLTPFEIFNGELHVDTSNTQLQLDYMKLVNEDAMSEWFVEVLQFRLAKQFATAIANSASLAGFYAKEEDLALRRARFADSMLDSPNQLTPSTLVELRRT